MLVSFHIRMIFCEIYIFRARKALKKCAQFIEAFAAYPVVFDNFNEFENTTLYAGMDNDTVDNLKWVESKFS